MTRGGILRLMTASRRNPLLEASRLVRRHRVRRLWRLQVGLLAVAAAVVLAWLWPILLVYLRRSAGFSDYAGAMACAAAAYAGSAAHRLHERLLRQHDQSWLASTPIPDEQRREHDRRMLVHWFAIRTLALFGLIAVVGAHAENSDATELAVSGVAILAGFALGTLGGWLYTPSRLAAWVVSRAGRRGGYQRRPRTQPGIRALQRLCTTRLANEATGRHMASLLAPVLLLVPAGTSAAAALCVIGVWLGIILGADLWRVAHRTLPELAHWLAATPLPRRRLIWLLGNRPTAWCLSITVADTALLSLLGWPLQQAAVASTAAAMLAIVALLLAVRLAHAR